MKKLVKLAWIINSTVTIAFILAYITLDLPAKELISHLASKLLWALGIAIITVFATQWLMIRSKDSEFK